MKIDIANSIKINKLVTIIIPCYKDSRTLERAILSVIAQTYPSIEIIVVNDSSPESEAIETVLSNYPSVRYLVNNVNLGLAASRNKGLQFALGETVAFLDADDEYHPNKIKIQMAELEPYTVVTCNVINRNSNGQTYVKRVRSCVVDKPNDILFRNKLVGACILAPKKLLLEIGGYNSELKSCEDFDLWLRLLSYGIKIKFIGDPLYIYWFNPIGLSKNFKNISKWELKVILNYAEKMGEKWRNKPYYAIVISFWLIRHLMRSELARDRELRDITITNIDLLYKFPTFKILLKIIAYSHLLVIPASLIFWAGGLRSGTN
ncbi:glycosyltransferase family 2 protein [Flavobacterium sp.]|uniref:glycosyltransferase family 2 protein n=1 Tax=Flavobacterium sp. TaxID=239 RepID=UPI0040483BD5